jgi:hypothetical protein
MNDLVQYRLLVHNWMILANIETTIWLSIRCIFVAHLDFAEISPADYFPVDTKLLQSDKERVDYPPCFD